MADRNRRSHARGAGWQMIADMKAAGQLFEYSEDQKQAICEAANLDDLLHPETRKEFLDQVMDAVHAYQAMTVERDGAPKPKDVTDRLKELRKAADSLQLLQRKLHDLDEITEVILEDALDKGGSGFVEFDAFKRSLGAHLDTLNQLLADAGDDAYLGNLGRPPNKLFRWLLRQLRDIYSGVSPNNAKRSDFVWFADRVIRPVDPERANRGLDRAIDRLDDR